MPAPQLPDFFLEAQASARRAGEKFGRLFVRAIQGLAAVPVISQPAIDFWSSIRTMLEPLSPAQRLAAIEAAVMAGTRELHALDPSMTDKGHFQPVVMQARFYDGIFAAAQVAAMQDMMPFDNVVAGVALRCDSVATDFSNRGYEGNAVEKDAMHAIAAGAYSLDPAVLAECAEYLPTFAVQAADRLPADAKTLGVIWRGLCRNAQTPLELFAQLANASNFEGAVEAGEVDLCLLDAGRMHLLAQISAAFAQGRPTTTNVRRPTLH